MSFLFMLLGAAFGAWFTGAVFDENNGWTGALFGLVCGLLFAQLRRLRARVAALEQTLAGAPARPVETPPVATPAEAAPASFVPSAPMPEPTAAVAAAPVPEPAAVATAAAAAAILTVPPEVAEGRTPVFETAPEPTAVDKAVAAVRRWFTEGNVPVKIGVIVLFLGIAALLKYAADQGWLRLPPEFKLAGIAAAALGALVFAWRKRESHRNFALSLQGGAIGVLILTVFAAYRLYGLLPPGLAFALLVVVVAGAALLAVLQDAIALAVLAIVGGFLAPVLISTGSNNHVALFSYYAVLNAAVFAIAWVRPWRILNLIGFGFTFGIGTAWGVLGYDPTKFASTEPFLLLFFAFYLLIPLFYALRQAPDRREPGSGPGQALLDGTLVFGTPLVAFALQVALLERARMPLAFSAIGAAAIYAALAFLELRRLRIRLLGESHALLAIGFATIAIPLALSAKSTACTWAIEGAALVWLGLRQQRRLPRWIGYALQLFAGVSFGFGFRGLAEDPLLLNGEFLGALLIALAGLASARLLDRATPRPWLSSVLFGWGLLWWLFAFGNEIERYETGIRYAGWWLALFAATGLIGAELRRRIGWRDCRWAPALAFALAPCFIALTTNNDSGPVESWNALAWAFWLVASLRVLVDLRDAEPAFARALHVVFLATAALLLVVEAGLTAERRLELLPVWVALAAYLPVAALFWLALRRLAPARWPLGDGAEAHRAPLLTALAFLMGIGALLGLFDEGNPAPLPYVPLVNPLELAQFGYFVLLLLWFRQSEREGGALLNAELRARALAVAGIVLLTAITLRATHFLGGVPWDDSLSRSPLAQAALSITWTLAGIAAMLLGKRRSSRAVWFGGAALMGVVLVKLLLVDREFMHDLPAIIGVLVVGVLLVAVGYFAPVPPRVRTTDDGADA